MNLDPFTADHEAFRLSVRKWVAQELAPHALAWDEAGIFPAEIFRKAGELGFLGLSHGRDAGGADLDYFFVVVLVEELARSGNAGVNMALLVHSEMATPILDAVGTPEQKALFLEPAIRGEKIAALAISEPGAGSDVAGLRTTARRDGDDLIIDGSKMWITNGTRADFLTLAVRTGEAGHGGISLVTFPTDVRGFSVGGKLEKVGNLSSDTAILYFDGCRIPRRFLLGEENGGFYQLMTNFQGERLVGALMANAAMDQMIEQALRHGREREAFGRPIGTFQVWRHRFAEHLAAMEAGRQLAYDATRRFDEWRRGRLESPPILQISKAKLYSCDLAQRVAYDCMQFFGGMGYVTETPIARAWRDVRLLTIGGGTSEMMKEIIARYTGV